MCAFLFILVEGNAGLLGGPALAQGDGYFTVVTTQPLSHLLLSLVPVKEIPQVYY